MQFQLDKSKTKRYIIFANSPRLIYDPGVFVFKKIIYTKTISKMKKILVQFDGNNFYNKVKKILPSIHLTHYKYDELIKALTKTKNSTIIYYVGEIKKISRK